MPGQDAAEEVYQEIERLFFALARRDFIDLGHKKCIHDTQLLSLPLRAPMHNLKGSFGNTITTALRGVLTPL